MTITIHKMSKRVWESLRENKFFVIYFSLFGLFFARVWSIALFLDEFGLRSGWMASWADGAAHLSYMSAFAYRSFFPASHPLYLGKVFSYPFVADMMGGYLVKLGLPLWTAYNLLGFILSMWFVWMVWKLYEYFFSDSGVVFLGGLIFFLAGGLSRLPDLLPFLSTDAFATHDVVNIISAQVMPQRALILGMPIAIWILLTVFNFFENKQSNKRLLIAGILSGLLPIIHSHSLIVVFLISLWLFLIDTHKNKKIRKGWWWYGIPSVILGSLLLWRQTLDIDTSFFRLQLGWLAESKDENWIWMWIKFWGVFPLVSWLGFSQLKWSKKLYFYPFLLLFLLINIFVFQPYDWDNTKLLIWIYLFFSGVAGLGLKRIFLKNKSFGMIILLSLIFSGLMQNFQLLKPQDNPTLYLYFHDDLKLSESIRDQTDQSAVFLTNDYHLSLIPVLTGRQIVMGYPGWLWTYGVDYLPRSNDISDLYMGIRFEELVDKYQIDYIDVDTIQISKGVNIEFFDNNFEKKFENENHSIYKISIKK